VVALILYLVWPSARPGGELNQEIAALREHVATMRREAVSANAERLAPGAFRAADRAEREAASAAVERRATRALSGYAEALAGFQRAAAEAQAAAAQSAQKAEAEAALATATRARADAEKAGAGRHARDAMTSADARERDGQEELRRGDYAAAIRAFRTAEAEYRKAIAAAPPAPAQDPPAGSDPPPRAAELREARDLADGARRLAGQAAADVLAKPQFEAATARWTRAEDSARKGEAARALGEFKAAGRLWEEARRRAATALGELAEHARGRSVAARTAGADLLFAELYQAASVQLARGDEQRKSGNAPAAAQGYRQATSGFDELVARVEGEPRIRAEAEGARMRRAEALRAGADRLAAELFESAARREVEAGRLARGPDVAAAIAAYKDAAERYRQAERGATASK
jgi:hypothetical protein